MRAAFLYAGQGAEHAFAGASESALGSTIALFMAPLQFVVAAFMLQTAYALVARSAGDLRRAVPMLGAFSLMELLFAGVRLRVHALQADESARKAVNASPVLGRRGLATSLVLCAVYAASGISLSLAQ